MAAVATPRPASPAPPAAAAGAAPEARAPRVLLAAVAACLAYASFAKGGISIEHSRWVVTGLALTGAGAVAAWLYARGLTFRASRLGVAGLVALAAYTAWAALSVRWSVAPDLSWFATNRYIGFALAVFAGVLLGSSLPRAAERVGGMLAVVSVPVALYALGGKTLPGLHIAGLIDLDQTAERSRLQAPIGYWNALAFVCVTGALPMLRMAADPRRTLRLRLAAFAGVYLMVLTAMLTYSRGGVIVMIVGVATLVALGTERLRTALLFASAGVAAAIPLAFALSSKALTLDALPVSVREKDSFWMLLITVGTCGLLLLWGRAVFGAERDPRFSGERGRAVGRRLVIALAAVVAVVAITVLASGRAGDEFDKFRDGRNAAAVTDPNRLLSTDSGNRWAWWREAAGAFGDRPAKGWGADAFGVAQRLYRKDDPPIGYPHSVPLQWLAENGFVGFALAAGALLALLATALGRVRSLPTAVAGAPSARGAAAALFGVAVAWTIQCFFEWTWNIPAATVPMLLCLGVLAARPTRAPTRPVRGRAVILGGSIAALVLVVTSASLPVIARHKSNDAFFAAARENVSDDQLDAAASKAAYAARLNPLAVDALANLAIIDGARGRPDEARAALVKAVRRQPYDVESWIALLQAEVARGDRAASVKAVRRILALDPGNQQSIDLASVTLQNLTFPNESSTATGTPLPQEVSADDPRPAVP